MNQPVRLLICVSAGLVLCQCSSTKKKNIAPSEMKLSQRAMLKPDASQRSSFEKYITDPKTAKGGSAGAYFQKQMHHSKSFNGGDAYAGQKQFKTNQSGFGKSQARGADMTYALGDKQPSGMDGAFKTSQSRLGGQQSRDGGSTFNSGDNIFKTGSALTRSKGTPEAPLIIENYGDKGGKKSAYSEDEVKKLLNRN
ncbi:hypothetical protein [Prosthecobacter sp.]|uniref:hypothetical protein n=1 Tax=Prosthecobacter sp. TaxID=1965333 RepID=UPI002AB86853|nr:hypothetical protein [Prosthecobacter sp.]MDZ4402976.1 hypothetical protein [Prosthecobacter sp.]